jgi:hypothetical protein
VKLSTEDISAIRALAERANELIPGARYPPGFAFSYIVTPALDD